MDKVPFVGLKDRRTLVSSCNATRALGSLALILLCTLVYKAA
jgi:hypothetical protein